jgi:hypothetical protein
MMIKEALDKLKKHEIKGINIHLKKDGDIDYWEVVEEPKQTLWEILYDDRNENNPLTLSCKDRLKRIYACGCDRVIHEIRKEHDIGMERATRHIKKYLKEFLDCLPEDGYRNRLNKAKEIFGEEMLK